MIRKMIWGKVIICIVGALCVLFGGIGVFATGDGDGGSGTAEGEGDLCAGGYRFSFAYCDGSSHYGQGAASWHIYKTGESIDKKTMLYTGIRGPVILDRFKDGYDKKLAEICPFKKNKYYFALVLDGWDKDNGLARVDWGPLAERMVSQAISGLQYNQNPNWSDVYRHGWQRLRFRHNYGRTLKSMFP